MGKISLVSEILEDFGENFAAPRASKSEIFRDRLTSIAKSAMQEVLGRYSLSDLLSRERSIIMKQIHLILLKKH